MEQNADCDSGGLRWGLTFYTYNKSSRAMNGIGSWATLWVARVKRWFALLRCRIKTSAELLKLLIPKLHSGRIKSVPRHHCFSKLAGGSYVQPRLRTTAIKCNASLWNPGTIIKAIFNFNYSLLYVTCVPPKDVKVLISVPVNVSFFGNRVFADDQVKIKSGGWPLVQ